MPSPSPTTVSTVPASETKKAADSLGAVPVSRYVLFFTLAVVGCGIDLWSKYAVFAWLGMPGQNRYHWFIEPYVGFQTSLNEGALFGLGQGYTSVFAVFSVVAALGILYWLFIAKAAHDAILTTALGLITGGIFGNLYDRLGIWGQPAVRDFILFRYNDQYVWPNFNIADALLVCGAILMLWHSVFASTASKSEEVSGDPS
ncbi:signal peptidase II [Blastopirellula marina]|uniref:Lipoprotein signal peptidase n=1 Tax=Blastopirellula marina TaxID=124 RepID=A0A2S8G4F6_9BACT|nr:MULTISPECIES: signal peptidase II [Pirellulaceae]PQO39151.1 signal peptidase II [Blastopirellula marina]RCS55459.1 signal peptidase II [Bremerella cremea]